MGLFFCYGASETVHQKMDRILTPIIWSTAGLNPLRQNLVDCPWKPSSCGHSGDKTINTRMKGNQKMKDRRRSQGRWFLHPHSRVNVKTACFALQLGNKRARCITLGLAVDLVLQVPQQEITSDFVFPPACVRMHAVTLVYLTFGNLREFQGGSYVGPHPSMEMDTFNAALTLIFTGMQAMTDRFLVREGRPEITPAIWMSLHSLPPDTFNTALSLIPPPARPQSSINLTPVPITTGLGLEA